MRHPVLLLIIFISLMAIGCAGRSSTSNNTTTTAVKTVSTPEDGYYKGKGTVTKINNDAGSVEVDHEEIPNLMPAMKMEFNLKDKAMLKSVAVGDTVVFTIEYKQGQEVIIAIGKQ